MMHSPAKPRSHMFITETTIISALLISILFCLRILKSNKKTRELLENAKKEILSEIILRHNLECVTIKSYIDDIMSNQHILNSKILELNDRFTFIEAFIYFSDSPLEIPVIDKSKSARSESAKKMWARRKLKEMANREE